MKHLIIVAILCGCVWLSGCSESSEENRVTYENVDSLTAEAKQAFDDENYERALENYAEALKVNPVDMNAQLGIAECQIALGDYVLAATDLAAAVKVNPYREEIYDLYVKLGEASGDISYVRTAVATARTYQIESFLDKVPEKPELSYPDGQYNSKLQVEITTVPDCQVYVSERRDSSSLVTYQYEGTPITVIRGKTDLEVYAMKDGIPSETVTAHYICDYAPEEVTFADPVIEKMVRVEIGLPNGPIMDTDCEGITNLNQYDLRNNGMNWEEYDALRVATLEDLKFFPNLQSLNLENIEQGIDFYPLAQCSRLYSLYLQNGELTDISFVSSMKSLQNLDVNGNNISDLSPIAKCSNLYYLDISGNPVSDLTVIKELDLRDISLDFACLPDLSFLMNWENLEYLSLYGCGGQDLSPLTGLNHLKSLYLYAYIIDGERETPLGDISFIQNLPQLERLTLSGLTDYSQVEYVKSLTNLTYLYLRTLDWQNMPGEMLQDLQNSLPGCRIN